VKETTRRVLRWSAWGGVGGFLAASVVLAVLTLQGGAAGSPGLYDSSPSLALAFVLVFAVPVGVVCAGIAAVAEAVVHTRRHGAR
jgi:hypothetical protein